MRPFKRIGLLVLVSALTASHPLRAQTPHDSIHYSAAQLGMVEQWTLASPDLVVGGLDGTGPEQFDHVGSIVLLSGGRFALIDWGTAEIRVFDSTGAHLNSFGGHGQGPGEFQQITKLFRLHPDSLATWDPAQGRGPVYSSDGGYGRQVTRPTNNPRSWVHGVFADGTLLMASMAAAEPDPANRRTLSYSLHLLGPAGELGAVITTFPSQRLVLSPELGYWTNITFGSAGAAAAGATSVWVVSGDSPALHQFRPSGAQLSVATWEEPDRLVSHAQIEEFWRAYELRGDDFARTILERRQLPVADSFPATGQVIVDADNRVWVQRFPRPLDDGERWLVFSNRSHLLATVAMPPGFSFREADSSHVFGLARDELDVERVERRAIRPAG